MISDGFTQLNEKFIKVQRDYEALLESSMSQPPQPAYSYGRPAAPPQGYPPQSQPLHPSYSYGRPSPGPQGYGAGYPLQSTKEGREIHLSQQEAEKMLNDFLSTFTTL